MATRTYPDFSRRNQLTCPFGILYYYHLLYLISTLVLLPKLINFHHLSDEEHCQVTPLLGQPT